jgi:HD-like signal output (HDOD) protein
VKRILFVDDEPKVLEGLQRLLRPMRHQWEMAFVGGGAEALAALAARPFDVVVSDMRMPGMNGAQLLDEVMRRYPQMVRIILSGYSDQELILKSVGSTHQYLSKPCDAESLKLTVGRACALRDLLADEKLQLLVSRMRSLPSLPSLYFELVTELQSPEASIKKVGEIIARDLGMTAKILQIVNSAFFGIRRHVSSPTEASAFLGLNTVITLVLSIQVFSQFDQDQLPGFSPTSLWSHSMRVGALAKRITQAQGQGQQMAEEAFTAGLLHDAGKLVLAANLPQAYSQMLAQAPAEPREGFQLFCLPPDEAERQVFGATHAEIGAYLLGLWGLPDPIVEAVAFHHNPRQCLGQAFSPLTAVHVANALEQESHGAEPEEGASLREGFQLSRLDLDYLAALGLGERLPAWREICGQVGSDESTEHS